MKGATQATNGDIIENIDSMPVAYTYNADNTVATATVTVGAKTYKQTYTYVAGNVTAISGWVKQ